MASRALLAAAVVALTPALANAGFAPPAFTMSFDASGDLAPVQEFDWNTVGNAPVFGTHVIGDDPAEYTGWLYTGSMEAENGSWTMDWEIVFDQSPDGAASTAGGAFLSHNLVITNNDPGTQNFFAVMTMPLAKPILNPDMSGFATVQLTANLGGGTLSAPAGARIYTPRIDGLDETDGYLFDDPFGMSLPNFGNTSQVGSFGFPTKIPSAHDALSDISILLSFDLTPGDSAGIGSNFTVVPAPATLPLLAAFGLLSRRRRRR